MLKRFVYFLFNNKILGKYIGSFLFFIYEELKRMELDKHFQQLRSNSTTKGKIIFSKDTRIANLQSDKSKIVFGKDCSIKGELLIFEYGGEITMGECCYLGENSRIWSSSSVIIEDHVLVSHNVNIHDNDAHPIGKDDRIEQASYILRNGKLPSEKGAVDDARILIKRNAWICFNATVLKGVTIGENSIVAAGAIVTTDVPDNVVVAGIPAKIVKYL